MPLGGPEIGRAVGEYINNEDNIQRIYTSTANSSVTVVFQVK